jgi:hypothetical protein
MRIIKQGAEARVFESTFMGKKVVVKERFSKKYRHPVLDSKLTLKRLCGVGPSSVSSLFFPYPSLHVPKPFLRQEAM